MTRWRWLLRPAGDRLLAAVLFVAVALEALAADGREAPASVAVAIAALFAAPLAWRRSAPLAATAAAVGSGVALTVLVASVSDLFMPLLVMFTVAYGVGAFARGRASTIGLALVVAMVVAVNQTADAAVFGDYLFPAGFLAGAWAVGRTIRHRTALTAELHEAAVRAEEERAERAAHAVAEERRRIAREMHDIVAHSVSVMVVQAGGARRILDRDPERAVEAAGLVESTGRAALVEMRRLLGAFGTAPAAPPLEPQPSLGDLEGLVDRARTAGLRIDLSICGARRPLPAALDLAAYRVVQEALTNAVKHAPGSRVRVEAEWEDGELRLRVRDDGPGDDTTCTHGGGHGLVGMRERVGLFGGDLRAGPAPGGGFEVHARLPLRQHEVQPA